MRLATVRINGDTHAARLDSGELVLLRAKDVGELLLSESNGSKVEEEGTTVSPDDVDFAPLVLQPAKIICVGLNYVNHIREMGDEIPEYPTLFAKFARSLVGAHDEIVIPDISQAPDYEAELGIVIGREARNVDDDAARRAIAGFTVVNDVTMRDWQRRTPQWLQGKTFEQSTPVGPYLVSGDEINDAADLEVACAIDDVQMQSGRTSELVFGPSRIVSYISQFITLEPGDLIASGTPSGVGTARKPPVYLRPGQVLTTSIEGIGSCTNLCIATKD